MGDGGGGTRRNSLFRGGARWGSPEFAKSGTPGVNSTHARVRGELHAMRDRSRVLVGHVEACNGERIYGGGSA